MGLSTYSFFSKIRWIVNYYRGSHNGTKSYTINYARFLCDLKYWGWGLFRACCSLDVITANSYISNVLPLMAKLTMTIATACLFSSIWLFGIRPKLEKLKWSTRFESISGLFPYFDVVKQGLIIGNILDCWKTMMSANSNPNIRLKNGKNAAWAPLTVFILHPWWLKGGVMSPMSTRLRTSLAV